jgi:hypothetical protein
MNLGASGWRQGSVLPRELGIDLARLAAPRSLELGEKDLVVVVSHDCDISQRSLGKEPWVELVVARALDRRPDGARTRGKHPRLLEFDATLGAATLAAQVSASERWLAPRERLAGCVPAGLLLTTPPGIVPEWLSRKYIREAFPDEFNRRSRQVEDDLKQLLRTGAGEINSIYLALDDVELDRTQDYIVVMRAVLLVQDYGVEARRTQAQVTLGKLAAAMSSCDGIDVVDFDLVSERDVSLDDVRVMKRWSPFDSLSLSDPED